MLPLPAEANAKNHAVLTIAGRGQGGTEMSGRKHHGSIPFQGRSCGGFLSHGDTPDASIVKPKHAEHGKLM